MKSIVLVGVNLIENNNIVETLFKVSVVTSRMIHMNP